MENTKRNFKGHGAHKRFFGWAMDKMTGEDAFDIFYGEKGKDYPAEMKQEFTTLFELNKEMTKKVREYRKAFQEKWKEYGGECHHFHGEGEDFRGGYPFGPGNEEFRGPGSEDFRGHGHGFHGR